MDSVQSAIAKAPGTVGVTAKHLESGRTIRHNGDTVFFTASTFKVPVLVELYRQVDEGKIDLEQRVELTDALKAPGGGLLTSLGVGLQPTVHDLTMMMIIISDNTATDIIYNMVGRDNLNSTMQELAMSATKLPMNCRELLYSIVGLDPRNPDHTNDMFNERASLNQLLMDSDGYSEERSDVSSPDDMSRLIEMLYRGELMSPASTEGAMQILKSQQLNNIIPLLLPEGTKSGHKTGTYETVRCDVGIVFAPNGPYTVSIMAKHLPPEEQANLSVDLKLAAISRAVYDEMTA